MSPPRLTSSVDGVIRERRIQTRRRLSVHHISSQRSTNKYWTYYHKKIYKAERCERRQHEVCQRRGGGVLDVSPCQGSFHVTLRQYIWPLAVVGLCRLAVSGFLSGNIHHRDPVRLLFSLLSSFTPGFMSRSGHCDVRPLRSRGMFDMLCHCRVLTKLQRN